MNKTIQNLKVEEITTKKSQSKTSLEIESLGDNSGVIDARINSRIQEIEERVSGAEYTIENMDSTVKDNAKCIKFVIQNIQEIQNTMRRPNPRIIGIEESKDFQL